MVFGPQEVGYSVITLDEELSCVKNNAMEPLDEDSRRRISYLLQHSGLDMINTGVVRNGKERRTGVRVELNDGLKSQAKYPMRYLFSEIMCSYWKDYAVAFET